MQQKCPKLTTLATRHRIFDNNQWNKRSRTQFYLPSHHSKRHLHSLNTILACLAYHTSFC